MFMLIAIHAHVENHDDVDNYDGDDDYDDDDDVEEYCAGGGFFSFFIRIDDYYSLWSLVITCRSEYFHLCTRSPYKQHLCCLDGLFMVNQELHPTRSGHCYCHCSRLCFDVVLFESAPCARYRLL